MATSGYPNTKFTTQQLERFNDRIKNCLEDPRCRDIFHHYLKINKKPLLYNALQLWLAANNTTSFDEEKFFYLIDNVDGFNENPLLSISECEHKLEYIRMECCRILEKILPHYVEYLNMHHKL